MSSPLPAAESIRIEGPAGPLEALVEVPPGYDGLRCAVVCHPHPLHGGTMTNKVVYTAARALQERGYATVRFNFRGVEGSAGTFDDGRGETEDALAACDYARLRWPVASLSLAGFSFGSFVAFQVARQRVVRELVLIAPPVGRFAFSASTPPSCPWTVIQGDADDVVAYADVRAWVEGFVPPPRFQVLAGAGHFFHGRLLDLKQLIQGFLG